MLWSWDVHDVDLLLAMEEVDGAARNSYGVLMSDATDPGNEYRFKASKVPTVDFAAKAVGNRMDAYYKKYPDVSRNGHLWSVSLPTD